MGAPPEPATLSPPEPVYSYEHDGDRQFATTLARGLEVLRCFTPLEPMLGNKEISVRTGLPKPTVSRLTYTLTKLGYLRHNRSEEHTSELQSLAYLVCRLLLE